MPRDGSGTYTLPGGTTATTGTSISSSAYNSFTSDIETDMNTARPVAAGGTGAASESAARASLAVPGLADNNIFSGTQTFNGDVTATGDITYLGSELVDLLFPVGHVIVNTSGTNPGTYLTGTTWVAAAQGRAIVGVGSNGESTWTVGETQGSETHTLTESQIPSHDHSVNPPATTTTSRTESWEMQIRSGEGGVTIANGITNLTNGTTAGAASRVEINSPTDNYDTISYNESHTHSVNIASFNSGNSGGGNSHNNIQPSEGFYVWERTA